MKKKLSNIDVNNVSQKFLKNFKSKNKKKENNNKKIYSKEKLNITKKRADSILKSLYKEKNILLESNKKIEDDKKIKLNNLELKVIYIL